MLPNLTGRADEHIELDGYILRAYVAPALLVFGMDLRNATGRQVRTARAVRRGQDQSWEFDLRQVSGEGLFTIHLNSPRARTFGALLPEQRKETGSAGLHRHGVQPLVLAQTSFPLPTGTVTAQVEYDPTQKALHLRLSRSAKLGALRQARSPGSTPDRTGFPPPRARRTTDSSSLHRASELASTLTKNLDIKLWGGFSAPAIHDLERVRSTESFAPGERIGAAWALARWHAYRGSYDTALAEIRLMHLIGNRRIVSKMVVILEADCHLRIGKTHEAEIILGRGMAMQDSFDPDMCLAYANCLADNQADDDTRLQRINEVFRRAGYATIARSRPHEGLTFRNLCVAEAPRASTDAGPRVSVIMPVYNAEGTVGTALESLLIQTWPPAEIIVVDDASTDRTWDIVQSLARSSDTIIPVRQDPNQGVYAARNLGLGIASGDLITTHDADDWSHPQQIETQVSRMVADPDVKASRSHWVRVSDELRFVSLWRSDEQLIYPSWPSFMFRADVRDRLGAWDRVRAQADSEFIERFSAVFGNGALVDERPEVPLTFSLVSGTSLTGSSATSIRTVSFGLRRDYNDAAKWWHAHASGKDRLRLQPNPPQRPFPAPPSILPDRPARQEYDLLVVCDTNLRSDPYSTAMTYVAEVIEGGGSVAIFHWPSFDSYGSTNSAVWSLAQAGKLDAISAGEKVDVDTILIADPSSLQNQLDQFPTVSWKRLWVNADRTRSNKTIDPPVDYEIIARVLTDTFGSAGVWRALPNQGQRTRHENRSSRASPFRLGPSASEMHGAQEELLSFDREYLNYQRMSSQRGDGATVRLVEAVVGRAEAAFHRERLSVIDKTAVPASGDYHDYMTISPYWWPDPRDPNGPQVHGRDGMRIPAMQVGHPESSKYDYTRSRWLFGDITALALAHFFTSDDRFARHTAQLVRTWFVDPTTRMNPNLSYAQVKLGHNDNRGAPFGLIEFRDLHYVLDAVRLLASNRAFDHTTDSGLREWLGDYLLWLKTSPSGEQECAAENNHGSWYDLQVLAIAHHLGDRAEIEATLQRARGRLVQHFDSDGSQPGELTRTLSQHYCAFNLQAWIYLASSAERLGSDLWRHSGPYGAGLEKGLRWFLAHDGGQWPYEQIEPFERARLVPLCEAYRYAYPASDLHLGRQTLSAIDAPDDSPQVGIRPFWRIGSTTARNN